MSTEEQQEHHYHHAEDQTELEKYLNAGLEKIEPYSNQILIGFIAATIVTIGAVVWFRSIGATRSAGWQEFVANETPADFASLADEYPDSPISAWARLQAGRGFLAEGLRLTMTDRPSSLDRLGEAQQAFENLLQAGGTIPVAVREEALYGLATCLEALADGNTQPAIDAYEQLLQEFDDSQHARWAEHRVEVLKSGATKDFYAWFSKQNPTPGAPPAPQDFPTDSSDDLPIFDIDLPGTDEPSGGDAVSSPPAEPILDPPQQKTDDAPQPPSTPTTNEPQSPSEEVTSPGESLPDDSETSTSAPESEPDGSETDSGDAEPARPEESP